MDGVFASVLGVDAGSWSAVIALAADEPERRCLASIKEGLDQHRDACPMTPRAVYIAGEVYERFGWTNQAVCGVPVRPEDDRPVEWFRVDCPVQRTALSITLRCGWRRRR
jgi:hypothetical protein